jgi:hypothetical protein
MLSRILGTMAQYTIEPQPTRRELHHASRLILEKKKAAGYKTNEQVAKAMGMPSSDLSRLLNAAIQRKWGLFRLSRAAAWLGITIDEMLGRPKNTTKVMTPTGEYLAAETAAPPPLLGQAEMLRATEFAKRAAEDANRAVEDAKRALAEAAKVRKQVAGHAREILRLLETEKG